MVKRDDGVVANRSDQPHRAHGKPLALNSAVGLAQITSPHPENVFPEMFRLSRLEAICFVLVGNSEHNGRKKSKAANGSKRPCAETLCLHIKRNVNCFLSLYGSSDRRVTQTTTILITFSRSPTIRPSLLRRPVHLRKTGVGRKPGGVHEERYARGESAAVEERRGVQRAR